MENEKLVVADKHGLVTPAVFAFKLKERYPELGSEIDEDEGLGHLQISTFYRHVEKLAAHNKQADVKSALEFIDEIFRRGDPAVKNMVCVSFLEYISLENSTGHTIWSGLSPILKQEWQELQEYFAAMQKEHEKRLGLDEQ